MNEKIAKIFAAVCVVCAMIAMAACNSGGSDLPADDPDSAQSSEYVGEISKTKRSSTHKLMYTKQRKMQMRQQSKTQSTTARCTKPF